MQEIQIFKNEEFGIIRTMSDEQGQPLFCAKDVCIALGYNQPHKAIDRHVKKDDGTKRTLVDSIGRKQQGIFVNESGLYALILSSKLEGAKRFKHWVTGEVLPCIRKHGGYMVVRPDDSDEVILARALFIMKKTLERRDEQIAQLKPRAEYADRVLDSVSCFTTTQIAKEMNMTGIELNRLLCRMGIQYHQSGQYLLYAPYARKGYAKSRTFGYVHQGGILKTHTFLVWTERGRNFLHELMDRELAN